MSSFMLGAFDINDFYTIVAIKNRSENKENISSPLDKIGTWCSDGWQADSRGRPAAESGPERP